MVWGSRVQGARVYAGSGRDPKGALRPGRPATARTPRHTGTHTPQTGTRTPGRTAGAGRPRSEKDAQTPRRADTAGHGYPPPLVPRGVTHPHPHGRPAPPRPVTFMSLTMAWKSPPRAPHSFSAVSMLGPGRGGGGGARAAGSGGRSLRAGPGWACRLGPRSAAGRAALGGRGPPRNGAGHVAAGLAGGAGGAARAAGGAAEARALERRR